LYLSDKYEILNSDLEKLNEQETKDLIKKNILNYGQDPSLSDNPKEAVIEVFLNFDQEINKTGHVIKLIADSYLELIESKKHETQQTTEQLTQEFPLIIYLRQKMFGSDLTPIINEVEISEEITVDTVALKEK
jgi:phenolic acid decarboxylase